MAKHLYKAKIFIAAVLFFSLASYIQVFVDIFYYPRKISTKIIEFPCNNITMNITRYENSIKKMKKSPPSCGVIGYSADCFKIDYNHVSPLTEVEYDCLAKIYVAQYALAPLVMIRNDNPSIIISDRFGYLKK